VSIAVGSISSSLQIANSGTISHLNPYSTTSEVRAVYLANSGAFTVTNAAALGSTLVKYGYNEIYIDVSPYAWTGYTMSNWNSIIDVAKAYGLRVGVLFGFTSGGNDPTYNDASESSYPYGLTGGRVSWDMAYANGSDCDWGSFASPTAQARVKQVVQVMMTDFPDISDICLDYIRYPTTDVIDVTNINYLVDYSSAAKTSFTAWLSANGKSSGTWPNDFVYGASRWKDFADWRAWSVDQMVYNVRQWALQIRTNFSIGAATWTSYSGWTPDTYKENMGQDPAYWISQGWLDFYSPMIYPGTATIEVSRLTDELNYRTGGAQYLTGGAKGRVPIIPWMTQGGSGNDVGTALSNSTFVTELGDLRSYGCNGWILWRYSGPGWSDTSFTNIAPYLQLTTSVSEGSFPIFTVSTPTASNSIISWTTSTATTGKVEYSTSPLFYTTSYNGTLLDYIVENHATNTTTMTDPSGVIQNHVVTIPVSRPYYFRVTSNDSFISLTSDMFYVS
jgi:uncharacterized lipoprotein YddW (UPF0748 family)